MLPSLIHLGDDRVIDDAPLLVGEAAEGPCPILEPGDVADHERLGEGDGILALEGAGRKGFEPYQKSPRSTLLDLSMCCCSCDEIRVMAFQLLLGIL